MFAMHDHDDALAVDRDDVPGGIDALPGARDLAVDGYASGGDEFLRLPSRGDARAREGAMDPHLLAHACFGSSSDAAPVGSTMSSTSRSRIL